MSKKSKLKVINFKDVEKTLKKINTYETYIVDPDTNSVIKYYPIFDEKKIDLLKKEAFEKLSYNKEKGLAFFENDFDFYNYIYFLVIKYFTHFEKLISDDFSVQIDQMDKLVSTGLYELIITDVLPQEEVQKAFDAVMDTIQMAEKIKAAEEQLKTNISNRVKSVVVKKKLGIDG